jgi:hypothetical protein
VLIVQFYLETVSDAGRFVYVLVTIQVLGATKAGRDEPSNQQSYRLTGFFDVYKQLM